MRVLRTLLLAIVVLWTLTANAQSLNLAKSYFRQENYLEAAKQLRPLADGGNAEAQYLAAYLFFEGKGVQKSEQQGVKYAGLSANQGNEDAVMLMTTYYYSRGNHAKAYEVLDKYVQQLNAWKSTIGLQYATYLIRGIGCERNPVRGYHLMELCGKGSAGWQHLFANAKDYLETMAQADNKTIPEYVVSNTSDYHASKYACIEMMRKMTISEKKQLYLELLNLARNNNSWAMYLVGKILEEGLSGSSPNPVAAKGWYLRAKEAYNPIAGDDYKRMDKRFWLGEKFKDGETVFWVSDDGKVASVMSASGKFVDRMGGLLWARQTNGWRTPDVDELKKMVLMLKTMGWKTEGYYWAGNYLCQFGQDGNLIKTYNSNNIPTDIGQQHWCFLITNIKKN